ncbi:hypothetical protein LCGC14_2434800, partial [marine sediment metagenome]
MVITYSFDYDPDEDLLTNVDTTVFSKAANAIKLWTQGGDPNSRIGVASDNTSVAGSGKGRLNNFNGYPLKNIDWDLYIIGANLGGLANTHTIGLELTFDNGDVMRLYGKGNGNAFNNERYKLEYSGTQTQAEVLIGRGQASGNNTRSSLKIISAVSGSDRIFSFFDTDDSMTPQNDSSFASSGNWDASSDLASYTVT